MAAFFTGCRLWEESSMLHEPQGMPPSRTRAIKNDTACVSRIRAIRAKWGFHGGYDMPNGLIHQTDREDIQMIRQTYPEDCPDCSNNHLRTHHRRHLFQTRLEAVYHKRTSLCGLDRLIQGVLRCAARMLANGCWAACETNTLQTGEALVGIRRWQSVACFGKL